MEEQERGKVMKMEKTNKNGMVMRKKEGLDVVVREWMMWSWRGLSWRRCWFVRRAKIGRLLGLDRGEFEGCGEVRGAAADLLSAVCNARPG